jgi:hypothetical protein
VTSQAYFPPIPHLSLNVLPGLIWALTCPAIGKPEQRREQEEVMVMVMVMVICQ